MFRLFDPVRVMDESRNIEEMLRLTYRPHAEERVPDKTRTDKAEYDEHTPTVWPWTSRVLDREDCRSHTASSRSPGLAFLSPAGNLVLRRTST